VKVLIVNTHSVLNSGDAGIVLGEIQFLRKHFPSVEIALTSRTPEMDQVLYNSMGVKVFPPIIPAPSVFSSDERMFRQSLNLLLNVRDKKSMLSYMKRCDLVIGNGGGYFWSNRALLPGPMLFQNYLHVRLASLLGKPIVFFPQSFGPFRDRVAPKILRAVLGKSNVIKVWARETKSLKFLETILGAEEVKALGICPDMAFFLSGGKNYRENGMGLDLARPRIAITVREWDFPEMPEQKRAEKKRSYLSACRDVCRKAFMEWGSSIIIFAQARGPGVFENDIPISHSLLCDLRQHIPERHLAFMEFDSAVSPFKIIGLLSQVDLIIATRFHSAVFALLSGIPAVSIGYQPKSRGVMQLLDLEEYCIDIAEMDSNAIFRMVESILENRQYLSRKIQKNVDRLRGEMESKLKDCLNGFL
jgi:colanic acid/amylovoran biosynthesis protein